MPEQHGDKSQEPTPHRREKAREEGHVPQSHDLASVVVLLAGTLGLIVAGSQLITLLARYARQQMEDAAWLALDVDFAVAHWQGVLHLLGTGLLPILALVLLAAVAIHVAQSGFLFLPAKLLPDPSRISPLRGLKRIFSLSNVVRLALGLLKLLVIAGVAVWALWGQKEHILGLALLDVPQIAAYLGDLVPLTILKIGGALLVLALVDYGYQYWKHEQDLKMTPQEVREELRNLEGDPQIAARRKVVQRQLAVNRMSQAVPKADVVVTNPTELAVAIQYEPETMEVPVVVAKGAGLVAERIRRLALEHGIPVVERKELAQALFRDVEVNQPIPQDKYAAVAEVLAYVYHLKGKTLPSARR